MEKEREAQVAAQVAELLWELDMSWIEEASRGSALADEWLAIQDELVSQGREDDEALARDMIRAYLFGEAKP